MDFVITEYLLFACILCLGMSHILLIKLLNSDTHMLYFLVVADFMCGY